MNTSPLPLKRSRLTRILCLAVLLVTVVRGELKLPQFFSDHMVLQRDKPVRIWGWDAAATSVVVHFAGTRGAGTAGPDGRWEIVLPPMAANSRPAELTVRGTSEVVIKDVLVGEVWLCSGQSNMNFTLANAIDGDLERVTAPASALRLLKFPLVASQQGQVDIPARWTTATPETTAAFSAVGFFFGQRLHAALDVPIGLIHCAWGGSETEAWIERSLLEKDPRFQRLMAEAAAFDSAVKTGQAAQLRPAAFAHWEKDWPLALREGRPIPAQPFEPKEWLVGNARPGNLHAGMIQPIAGLGLRGVIWYQGESNARRSFEHLHLFPFLIETWRQAWGDRLSFYWVQLADYFPECAEPGESQWAELRETQTLALRLPGTGQAVTIDLGDTQDIHPRRKREVALRLARLALANDYGQAIAHRSPQMRAARADGQRMIVEIDCFGSKLQTVDRRDVQGFAICGPDRNWHWAQARITGDHTLEVWSDRVPAPLAVRYAWADNPVCNLVSAEGLPLTPFRTDDFPYTTASPAPDSGTRYALP